MEKINKVENMEKFEKIFLFLNEINKNMSKEEVKNIYENKYNLGVFRNNKRVLNRFMGVDSKYSKEDIEKNKIIVSEKLKKVNINYSNFIEKIKIINKRSNRLSILKIEEIDFSKLV